MPSKRTRHGRSATWVCDVTAALEPYNMQQADQYHLHCTSSIFRVETQGGFVIVDSAEQIKPGDEVAFQYDGYPTIGILFSSGLITPDSETMEEEVMERIIVLGKVSATILDDGEPYSRPSKSVLLNCVAHMKHKKIQLSTSYSPD